MASPKLDVEGIRNSDTRDQQLVPSEFFRELGSSVLPAYSHGCVGTVLVQRRRKIGRQSRHVVLS